MAGVYLQVLENFCGGSIYNAHGKPLQIGDTTSVVTASIEVAGNSYLHCYSKEPKTIGHFLPEER